MKIKSGNIRLDHLLKECDELIKRTVQIKTIKNQLYLKKTKPAFIDPYGGRALAPARRCKGVRSAAFSPPHPRSRKPIP